MNKLISYFNISETLLNTNKFSEINENLKQEELIGIYSVNSNPIDEESLNEGCFLKGNNDNDINVIIAPKSFLTRVDVSENNIKLADNMLTINLIRDCFDEIFTANFISIGRGGGLEKQFGRIITKLNQLKFRPIYHSVATHLDTALFSDKKSSIESHVGDNGKISEDYKKFLKQLLEDLVTSPLMYKESITRFSESF